MLNKNNKFCVKIKFKSAFLLILFLLNIIYFNHNAIFATEKDWVVDISRNRREIIDEKSEFIDFAFVIIYDEYYNDTYIEIIKYNGAGGDIVLPDFYAGYPVKSIENKSFGKGVFENKNITSVKIPETYINIGDRAFFNNDISGTLIFPNSVNRIGKRSFRNNKIEFIKFGNNLISIENDAFSSNSIKELNFPNTLKHIGDWAFRFNNLYSIKIPDSVKKIGKAAFLGMDYNNIKLGKNFTSLFIISFDTIKGHIAPPQNLIIPDNIDGITIKKIGDFSFLSNNIISVSLPDSLEIIGSNAFIFNNINKIEFPENLKVIEEKAFRYNNLEEIVLPLNIEIIGNEAFSMNNSLEKVTIYNRNIQLSNNIFRNNSKLKLTIEGFKNSNAYKYAIQNNHNFFKLEKTKEYKDIIVSKTPEQTETHIKKQPVDYFEETRDISYEHQKEVSHPAVQEQYKSSEQYEQKTISKKHIQQHPIEETPIHQTPIQQPPIQQQPIQRSEHIQQPPIQQHQIYSYQTRDIYSTQKDEHIQGDFKFKLHWDFIRGETFAEIIEYTGEGGDLKLPKYYKNIPVRRVTSKMFGSGVFSGAGIKNLIIPNSYNYIGRFAFENNNIISIQIGMGVDISANNSIPNNFKIFYDNMGQKEGTYFLE